jgi:hypothetical protein
MRQNHNNNDGSKMNENDEHIRDQTNGLERQQSDHNYYEMSSDCDELTCGMCSRVVNNPIETKCCRKTYCKNCIITWINANQLCPNDKRVLKVNDLINPSLIVVNLLSKLKIKCNDSANECQEVISFESLSIYRNNNYRLEVRQNEPIREVIYEQGRQQRDHNLFDYLLKGILFVFTTAIMMALLYCVHIFFNLLILTILYGVFIFLSLLIVLQFFGLIQGLFSKTFQKTIALPIIISYVCMFSSIIKQLEPFIRSRKETLTTESRIVFIKLVTFQIYEKQVLWNYHILLNTTLKRDLIENK